MTVNSFFAGIGGFDLGLENVGFEVKFQCEIDDFCNRVLRHHWPDVPIFQDIRQVNLVSIPDAEVWCGGFPCQDVSLARGANGRKGLKGKNSGLFFDFLALIKRKLPRVILLENVTGLLSSHNGADFKIIIESLTELGYGVSWRVLNTRYFGAPQSRPRVYICAWKGSLFDAVNTLHEQTGSTRPVNPRIDFLNVDPNQKDNIKVPKIGYCLAATSGRHTGTDWSRTYVSYFDKVRRLTPMEAEGLQGFPRNWTLIADIRRRGVEVDSLRYHAIGNAVSVPVIEWIGHRVKRSLNAELGADCSIEGVRARFVDFNEANKGAKYRAHALSLPTTADFTSYKWLSGGFAYGDKIVQGQVESCPSVIVESRLIDVIEKGQVSKKYYLSPTAARGILRRVTGQNRKLFQPLYDALIRLAECSNSKDDVDEVLFDSVREG